MHLDSSSVSSLILIGENLTSSSGSGLGDLEEISVVSGFTSFFCSTKGEISRVLVKLLSSATFDFCFLSFFLDLRPRVELDAWSDCSEDWNESLCPLWSLSSLSLKIENQLQLDNFLFCFLIYFFVKKIFQISGNKHYTKKDSI